MKESSIGAVPPRRERDVRSDAFRAWCVCSSVCTCLLLRALHPLATVALVVGVVGGVPLLLLVAAHLRLHVDVVHGALLVVVSDRRRGGLAEDVGEGGEVFVGEVARGGELDVEVDEELALLERGLVGGHTLVVHRLEGVGLDDVALVGGDDERALV